MQQHSLLTSGTASCSSPSICRKPALIFQRSFRSFSRSCTGSKRRTQCRYKPETQRQSQNVPAPPVKANPPPPPPPPPPPSATEGPSRRTIGLLLLGGSLVSYALRKSQDPQFYRDKAGIRYLKTDKGNPVAVTTDDRGNIMMVDPAGNLYYDTGSPQLGIYMVTMNGDMYNLYIDTEGEQQKALVGNVKDLRTIKVKDIGGIPIEKLQAHYEIQRNRAGKKDNGFPDRFMGFPEESRVPLPPGTVKVFEDGKGKIRLQGPEVLDEGAIQLEEKRNLWPFTQIEPGGGDFHRGIE